MYFNGLEFVIKSTSSTLNDAVVKSPGKVSSAKTGSAWIFFVSL